MQRLPRFIFIFGTSGAGTTMLSRILSHPALSVSLGGNHIKAPESDAAALRLVDRFNALTLDLWDRHADFATVEHARTDLPIVFRELFALPSMRHITHAIYKRSAPFMLGDRYRPSLRDVFELFDDARIVAVYRDPCAAAASSFRRGFAPSLRQCAVITEEQLTYANAQLAAFPKDRFLAFGYERFCRQPDDLIAAMANLADMDEAALHASLRAERVDPGRNERWRNELAAGDVAMLERFFDPPRRRLWPMLEQTRTSSADDEASGATTPAEFQRV